MQEESKTYSVYLPIRLRNKFTEKFKGTDKNLSSEIKKMLIRLLDLEDDPENLKMRADDLSKKIDICSAELELIMTQAHRKADEKRKLIESKSKILEKILDIQRMNNIAEANRLINEIILEFREFEEIKDQLESKGIFELMRKNKIRTDDEWLRERVQKVIENERLYGGVEE